MEKLNIIYVDDQREVLSTIGKELEPFEDYFILEECESADETMELLDEVDLNGDFVAIIICDHIMPGKNGIELLTEINEDNRFEHTKKILLTGMATHKDTIMAINKAGIDHYLEKPWKSDELIAMVKELVTLYILEKGIDYNPYLKILDQKILYDKLHKSE